MKITFDETTHTYTVDGRVVPSVTTVCRFLSYDQKSDKPWLGQGGRGPRDPVSTPPARPLTGARSRRSRRTLRDMSPPTGVS